jgi:hypothetical protein
MAKQIQYLSIWFSLFRDTPAKQTGYIEIDGWNHHAAEHDMWQPRGSGSSLCQGSFCHCKGPHPTVCLFLSDARAF